MPRILVIEDLEAYHALHEVVSKSSPYGSIKTLDLLSATHKDTDKLIKSALFDYLQVYYRAAYYVQNPQHFPWTKAALDFWILSLKSKMSLVELNQTIEVKGPVGAVPSSFSFPKLSSSSWEYLFDYHSKDFPYFVQTENEVHLSPETKEYWNTLEDSPENIVSFWNRVLTKPTGITRPEIRPDKKDFMPEVKNPGKMGLRKEFETFGLNLSFMRSCFIDFEHDRLKPSADKLWNILCSEPEMYRELRVSFIYQLCWGADPLAIIKQLATGQHRYTTYIEALIHPEAGFLLNDVFAAIDHDFKPEFSNLLMRDLGLDSTLDEADKISLFSRVRRTLNSESLLTLAQEYVKTDWAWFHRIKTQAKSCPGYDENRYEKLELEHVDVHKTSWPQCFNKLETVLNQIETYQKAQPSKITGALSSIGGYVGRVPGAMAVTGFISNTTQPLTNSVSENLDLHWGSTVNQLENMLNDTGFHTFGVTGPLKVFADEYEKTKPEQRRVRLEHLPLSLAQKVKAVCAHRHPEPKQIEVKTQEPTI